MTHSFVFRGVAASLFVLFLASVFASSGYGQKPEKFLYHNYGRPNVHPPKNPPPLPDLVPLQPCSYWVEHLKQNYLSLPILNQGKADAGATFTFIEYYFNGTCVASGWGRTPPIPAGQTVESEGMYNTIHTPPPPGALKDGGWDFSKLKVRITVNHGNGYTGKGNDPITESNTQNNTQTFDVSPCIQ
jgi:hypothetical protein